jgi:prevent-host-death family protein
MKRILISEFKAKCIELLKRVQATRQPLVVTLRGKPVAKVVPFEEAGEIGVKLGSRIGHVVSKGTLFVSISAMNGKRTDDFAIGHTCLVVGS